ncbi:hypothetical protein ACFE04_003959 [Oxalis oulophora]
MSRPQGPSSAKRKRPGSINPAVLLNDDEQILYDVIRSTKDIGIWSGDLKKTAKQIPARVADKIVKLLKDKNLIKEVVPIQSKGKKRLMAVEFEPSEEITGGSWYANGSLDMEFIDSLKKNIPNFIRKNKVVTLEGLVEKIKNSGAFKVVLTKEQVGEILKALVFDNVILEIKSNGSGEFSSIPVGQVCYKCSKKKDRDSVGLMTSIPCGVCPQISRCTPDGIISPNTCVYYKKWLDF